MELNVPLDQAQAGLDECVRAGNAFPDYDIARGHALYRFPEFAVPIAASSPIETPGTSDRLHLLQLTPPCLALRSFSCVPAPVAQLDRATVS